jgi:hypothetical protein
VPSDRVARETDRALHASKAADEAARGAYNAHRAEKASVLLERPNCRQVFTGYLLDVDRNLSDSFLFCGALSSRMKQLTALAAT